MTGEEKNDRNYVGYEYKELFTDISKVSQYLDGYENFGWIADDTMKQVKESDTVSLRLKRDRKIMNKVELTRLQRHFEDCMNQIELLEKSRASQAIAVSIAIGILGTAFMAGATFASVNEPPIIWLSILLAVPGFTGWLLPYFVFRVMLQKRTRVVEPLIEDKYDEIYEICEKGSRLLGRDLG
jgi:Flp pilus assembly protein TadB